MEHIVASHAVIFAQLMDHISQLFNSVVQEVKMQLNSSYFSFC